MGKTHLAISLGLSGDELREKAVQRVAEAEKALESARDALAQIDGFRSRPRRSTQPVIVRHQQKSTRGHWQAVVGEVLQRHPGGVRKRDLVEALGILNDVKQQANLSSALQLMKKSGHLIQDDTGRYRVR